MIGHQTAPQESATIPLGAFDTSGSPNAASTAYVKVIEGHGEEDIK